MSDYGNVLVVGSGGVGKSTLIRKVLGSDVNETGGGLAHAVHVYESLSVPYRVIDAGDLSGNFLSRRAGVKAVKRWSRTNALDGNADNDINVIWYCIEGKSRKLIRQQVSALARATDVWYSVPIIVVITKSYAELEREENVALVREACNRRRRLKRNVRAIIPVVADTYQLSSTTFVPPSGLPELLEATDQLMPEGVRAVKTDIEAFTLKRRRAVARSIVAASTAAGVTVGAVPIPISDALILTPIETAEVNALATLYGIGKGSSSKKLLNTILEVGTVSTAAKAAISALKAVPGINVAASALNAAIAGGIVAAIGEATMRVFERIYLGEKTIDDTEWVQRMLESSLSKDFIARGTKVLGKISGGSAGKDQKADIAGLLVSAFARKSEEADA
jgi:uncharacterized protein (DUF697 family)